MDRRGFFKAFIVTPLLTPFLLASEHMKGALQLCVIADSPQLFLPSILRSVHEYGLIHSQSFTLLNFHPEGKELKKALSLNGWKYLSQTSKADLCFSFSSLRQKVSPSFALIKNGRVWDIRSRKLYTLWKEMYCHHPPSSWLTTISLKDTSARIMPGRYASIYIDGKRVESLSLKKNAERSFRTEKGEINLVVKNGRAWVSDSSCHHKICLSVPPVSFFGERIICAPNHFLLEVRGSSAVDTVIG